MKQKRGLSGIVTTLIIIALSIVAVGIIWTVTKNVLESSQQEATTAKGNLFQKCSDFNYSKMGDGDICNATASYAGGEKCCSGFNFQATKGLVSYWSFDKNADDDFGNNDGTVYGATWNATGGHDGEGAYEFDGEGDYILVLNKLNQSNLEQEWSVSSWVKISQEDNQELLYLNRGLYLVYAGTNKLLLYLNAGWDDYYDYGLFNLQDEIWHHVIFVFRNSDSLREIYVDGVDFSSTGPDRTNTPEGISSSFRLGNGAKGTIDEVRIYNRALNASEIEILYRLG